MSVIQATEDKLASILVLNRKLEEYPEPYRGNKDMEILVSFDAYKSFIERYLEIYDYLATPTIKLKYYLSCGKDEELYRCFYLDMALAVAKEVWYTDLSGTPTRITHKITGADILDTGYVTSMSEIFPKGLSRARNSLLSYLANSNYKMAAAKTVTFSDELRYASLLYAMSSNTNEFDVGFYKWSYERSAYDTEGNSP